MTMKIFGIETWGISYVLSAHRQQFKTIGGVLYARNMAPPMHTLPAGLSLEQVLRKLAKDLGNNVTLKEAAAKTKGTGPKSKLANGKRKAWVKATPSQIKLWQKCEARLILEFHRVLTESVVSCHKSIQRNIKYRADELKRLDHVVERYKRDAMLAADKLACLEFNMGQSGIPLPQPKAAKPASKKS